MRGESISHFLEAGPFDIAQGRLWGTQIHKAEC